MQEFVDDAAGIGFVLVDLVDRHDDRDACGLRVIDGLDGLRHDAVVGGHNQHDDVGDLGAARAHRRERRVAGGIEERDALAVLQAHLVGADVLRDAARFAGDNVGFAERVEQRGLAVVDVAHDGHDRRARGQIFRRVLGAGKAFLDVRLGDAAHGVAVLFGDKLGGVGVEHRRQRHRRALLEHVLDDVGGAGGHARGEILHRDGLGNDDVAGDLRLLAR
ncbi:MAG: Uncharacterized protein FD124_3706, partial [Alphaproteobacteria bacterium]